MALSGRPGPGAGMRVVPGFRFSDAQRPQGTVAAAPAVPAALHGQVQAAIIVGTEEVALGLHGAFFTKGRGQRRRAGRNGHGGTSPDKSRLPPFGLPTGGGGLIPRGSLWAADSGCEAMKKPALPVRPFRVRRAREERATLLAPHPLGGSVRRASGGGCLTLVGQGITSFRLRHQY